MSWRVPLFRSPVKKEKGGRFGSSDVSTNPSFNGSDSTLQDSPEFHHYEQTSNIQLFFDLFFVANLTTFTARHEINGIHELSSYLGFFCILWFTWCQVTLYDVRFATDSIFERLAHICHFAVMVGLAIIGPKFDPRHASGDAIAMTYLQALSLILMASRIILFLQYTTAAIFTWRYRTTRLPLLLVMLSLAVTSALYGLVSIPFAINTAPRTYIAWYFIVPFEVGINILIAMRWRVLSFENTHLVERMGCLTLIVLGEGIVGLTGRVALIESLDFVFTPSTFGSIVSSLLIIYFIYMLYFDIVPIDHFGRVRKLLWTFLHFPFHMALVLVMEGTNQFVIWRHIVEVIHDITALREITPDTSALDLKQKLDEASDYTLNIFPPRHGEFVYEQVGGAITSLQANSTRDDVQRASDTVIAELYKTVFENYGFELNEKERVESGPLDEQLNAYYNIFVLVFLYSLVAIGCLLIGLAIIAWICTLEEDKTVRRYIGIFANLILGVGVLLLCTIRFTPNISKLGNSPYMLPMIVFILFASLLFNHLPRRSAPKIEKF